LRHHRGKRRIAELEAALDQANALNRRCIGAHEASLNNTILQGRMPAAVLGVTVAKPQASGGESGTTVPVDSASAFRPLLPTACALWTPGGGYGCSLQHPGRAMFNLRSLDLNLLTVFEAIYELGTVSAAAERIALTQSATSHALSRLREACNDELFVRAPQGLSPTPVAQAMYPTLKQALETLRATLAEASGFDPARSQRRFCLNIPHPMGPFYALALRTAVASVAPGIVLTFNTVSQPVDLEDNLRNGTVDIAIDWLPIELNPFANAKVFDDQLVLLARKNHPSINESMTLEDILKAEFVGPHRRRNTEHLPPALKCPFRNFLNRLNLLDSKEVV
jgi:DNA-binding transcriptional LysR family regulator